MNGQKEIRRFGSLGLAVADREPGEPCFRNLEAGGIRMAVFVNDRPAAIQLQSAGSISRSVTVLCGDAMVGQWLSALH